MQDNNEDSQRRSELIAIEKMKNEYRSILKNKKEDVNNSLIYAFYKSPEEFFSQYNNSLKNTCYFDICGNSIFMHYFYILYKDHCSTKNTSPKNLTSKNYINVYQNNFIKFFKEHKNNLIPFNLEIYKETSLHKIARYHDKTFFLKILKELHTSGILNDDLIKVKNIEEKTCCDYIFEEIENKYEYFLLKDMKNYSLFKNFVLLIKQKYYLSIFDPLSNETKALLNNFINKRTYDIIKKPDFESMYLNIENILKNEREINPISGFIYDPFNSVINYLNVLFDFCKAKSDYDKLFHLVVMIELIKEMKTFQLNKKEKNISLSHICIFDHMNYIFRKIKSSNGIKYCHQIIEKVFKNIIKNKSEEDAINIITFGEKFDIEIFGKSGKSFINSVILNSYLNFEDKITIISKLNEVTGGLAELEIFEIFPIYFFFKDSKQYNNDIIKMYDSNKNFAKLFRDFGIICYIYEYLMDLFGKDKNSLEKYVKLFDDFLLENNIWQIESYKMNYNLSIAQAKTILEKIKLYLEKKYENIEEKTIKEDKKYIYDYFPSIKIYKKDIENKIQLGFLLKDKDLCEAIVSDIFQRENNDDDRILAIKILFSFKYDFCNLIDKNSDTIKNCIKDNNNDITEYLLSLDTLDHNSNLDLQYKLISRLIKFGIYLNLKEDKKQCYIHLFKFRSLKQNNILKLSLTLKRDLFYKKKILPLESFSYSVTKYLVEKWDKPLKSFYITNNVLNNIEYYCILIIDNLQTFAEQKNAITFFFEEFILLLNPEIKDMVFYYKNICFDYMYTINSLEEETEEKENEKKEKEKEKEKEKISKYSNYFFLMMVLIHIKIKYGDYNPVRLFNISKYFNCPKKIFMSYVDCLHENLTKKEIIDHFLLSKSYLYHDLVLDKDYIGSNLHELYQKNKISRHFNSDNSLYENDKDIEYFLLSKSFSNQDIIYDKNYICLNFYKLKQKNHSFIFNSGLNIIPYLKLHLIPENNEEYIDSIIDIIVSQNIHFLEFLTEDYRTITSNQLRTIIYLLKSISKRCFIKYEDVYDDGKYEFISMNKGIKNNKINIFMNLYNLFKVLKALKITLYDCIKDNFFFMGETVSLFLDLITEKYECKKEMEDQIDFTFINNEMIKFLISFYKFCKDIEKKNKIKFKFSDKRFFIMIWKYFYYKLKILNDKSQLLLEYDFVTKVISDTKDEESNESNDFIELEFFSHINDEFKFKYEYNLNSSNTFDDTHKHRYQFLKDCRFHSFFYKKRNKIMDLIVEKIPEKFIDASNILASFCKQYNFIYEVNKLKKKNSEILIDYLLKAFSILISGERIDGYYYYKRFLIKNIINSVNNIQNINFDKNLDESDIFIDKSYSIKLLNYSFSNEKMKNLITKISDKYCEGKNDILFLEILKENITNEYVFN